MIVFIQLIAICCDIFKAMKFNMQHICMFLLIQSALRFHHCPPVLVLQLKRFQYTRWSWAQCQTHHLPPLFIQVSCTAAVKLSFQVSRTTQQPSRISIEEPGSQPLPDGAALSRSWRNGADHGWPCCCHE